MISNYLLYEQRRGMGRRSAGGGRNTYNAPQFIYSILYGEKPPMSMGGRDVSHVTKNVNNIPIDEQIPDRAVKELEKIKEIETRSSCQGQDENHPTFLIIRFSENQPVDTVEDFVNKLNKNKDIKAGYGTGGRGFYRIGITTDFYYTKEDQDRFEKWWLELPKKIKKAL